MPPADVPRDRWGRPLIVPPAGGEPVPYLRASSVGKLLADSSALTRWRARMTALGLVHRPDLFARVSTTDPDDRATLDALCGDALEAAGASAAANLGTSLHTATERHDLGADLGPVPDDVRVSVAAYAACLAAHGVVPVEVERFVVADAVRVAGTFDRLYRLPDGRTVIGDLKTSASGVRYGVPEWAAQLAVYANGVYYDPTTGARTPMPAVDRSVGLIVSLPAGGSTCGLHLVDLTAGWRAVATALWVREYRRLQAVPYAPAAEVTS